MEIISTNLVVSCLFQIWFVFLIFNFTSWNALLNNIYFFFKRILHTCNINSGQQFTKNSQKPILLRFIDAPQSNVRAAAVSTFHVVGFDTGAGMGLIARFVLAQPPTLIDGHSTGPS